MLGLRLTIFVILSVSLMLWDRHHQSTVKALRADLSLSTTPLVYAANLPFAFFEGVSKNLQSHQSLMQENTALQAKLLILQGEVQKLKALQSENQELRALLQSSPAVHHVRLMIAEIMAVQASPFQQEIVLNKGKKEGVFVGQAVLDAHGIMGQIVEVAPLTSRVLLLTDSRSAIPIQNTRTGLHGILAGQGANGLLTWENVPPTADVKLGDILESSGMGGHYPVGYPVGVVSTVNTHTIDQFLHIEVVPSAQMNSHEMVLLVWPGANT